MRVLGKAALGGLVVEPPVGYDASSNLGSELKECFTREIDIIPNAAHALVSDDGLSGLSIVADSNGPATIRVSIGLQAHHTVRKCDDVLSITVIRITTGSEPGIIVGHFP